MLNYPSNNVLHDGCCLICHSQDTLICTYLSQSRYSIMSMGWHGSCVQTGRTSAEIFARATLSHTQMSWGGPGVTVEIDESMFCRCKHNVGRQITEQWVFGGVEASTAGRRGFVVPIACRDPQLPVLQQFVLPGSTIVSDCWRAYNTVGLLGYQRLTVDHSLNFVNPVTSACTNNVDCYWKNAKTRNKWDCGTARTLLDSYLIHVAQPVWGQPTPGFCGASMREVPLALGHPTSPLALCGHCN